MARPVSERLTTGTVIVLVGLVLLLATTGLVEMRSVWGWIAALFVLIGVWALIRSEFRNLVGPVMMIAIAGTFLLRNVGVIPDDAIGTWWPLFVVLFGLLLVVSRSRRRQRVRLDGQDADEITAVGVLGTDDRRVTSDQFAGGELVAVLGDVILDLRDADVRARPATVETVTVLADTEIRVPDEWDVRLETLTILGDTVDRRPSGTGGRRSEAGGRPSGTGERPTDDDPDLVVTGLVLLGDLEIRD